MKIVFVLLSCVCTYVYSQVVNCNYTLPGCLCIGNSGNSTGTCMASSPATCPVNKNTYGQLSSSGGASCLCDGTYCNPSTYVGCSASTSMCDCIDGRQNNGVAGPFYCNFSLGAPYRASNALIACSDFYAFAKLTNSTGMPYNRSMTYGNAANVTCGQCTQINATLGTCVACSTGMTLLNFGLPTMSGANNNIYDYTTACSGNSMVVSISGLYSYLAQLSSILLVILFTSLA